MLGLALLVFTCVGVGFLVFLCVVSWLVRPHRRRPGAEETYECGIPAEGGHRGLGFQYFRYAIVFLVLDLAGLFLFLYVALGRAPLDITISFALGLVTLGVIIAYGTREGRHAA